MQSGMYFTVWILLASLVLAFEGQAQDTGYQQMLNKIQQAKETNATELFLDHIQTTALPPEIGELESLESLHLNNIGLKSLPPEIGQLRNLRVLDLSHNALTDFPAPLIQLKNLRWLDLSGNRIQQIPPAIETLHQLECLDLSSNAITHLPAELGRIHFSSDPSFAPCDGGQPLSVQGNPLVDPPPAVIEQGDAAIVDYLHDQYARIQSVHLWQMLALCVFAMGLPLFGFVVGWFHQGRLCRQKCKRNESAIR